MLDNRKNDAYQFAPAMINRNNDNTIDQALAYDDLINSLKYNEVDVNNHSKVLDEKGYTLIRPLTMICFQIIM